MNPPYVLAFVAENANGILRWWTQKILSGLARHGLAPMLIDLTETDWRGQLGDCLAAGNPEFVFSFQGIAMDLKLGAENFWALNGIPFLTYLGDSPYHAPALHAAHGPGLYLLYGCADFLDVYRDQLGGRSYSSLLPYGYPENPTASRTPWAERTHPIVYVKTGVDPSAMRRGWQALPPGLRGLLHDCSDRVLGGVDETVATVCTQAFAGRDVHCGDRRELFLFVCSTVDRYARAVRAERMVRALLPHDALIVGDWSHLDAPRARARFAAPVAAEALDALYADSRIVVSTLPTVRYGLHERIMAGLFAKAAVVSDTTPFLGRLLSGCPSFRGLDIDHADFPLALDRALHACLDDPSMPAKLDASLHVARSLFSFDDFIQALLDHLGIEQCRRSLGSWAFPPVPVPAVQP